MERPTSDIDGLRGELTTYRPRRVAAWIDHLEAEVQRLNEHLREAHGPETDHTYCIREVKGSEIQDDDEVLLWSLLSGASWHPSDHQTWSPVVTYRVRKRKLTSEERLRQELQEVTDMGSLQRAIISAVRRAGLLPGADES